MLRKEAKPTLWIYTMGIAALFLLGFFLLVVFGAKSFSGTVAGQYGNMETRSELSYLQTVLHANDTEDAVSVQDDGGRTVLVIQDGNTGYAYRLYLEDGKLLEDLAEEGTPLDPENAQVIGETAVFEAVREPSGRLRVRTDAGSILFTPRSVSGERSAG